MFDYYALDYMIFQLFLGILLFVGGFYYIRGVLETKKRKKKWPVHRQVCFFIGFAIVLFTIIFPLANSYENFIMHSFVHVLLWLIGPFFIAQAMPMTLLLRSLPVAIARNTIKFIQDKFVRILMHPLFLMLWILGWLTLLYTTNFYKIMYESAFLFLFIHIHLFWVNYLFFISILSIERFVRSYSYKIRGFSLMGSICGYLVLTLWLFINPQSELGTFYEVKIGASVMFCVITVMNFNIAGRLNRQRFKVGHNKYKDKVNTVMKAKAHHSSR